MSYIFYRVRTRKENGDSVMIPVCLRAFLAFHGIGKKRIQGIQGSVKTTGAVLKDRRGKHTNRPHKLKEDIANAVIEQIKGLTVRQESTGKSSKLYLPERLNVKMMYDLFKEAHPSMVVSYQTYRVICRKHNIVFGPPKTRVASQELRSSVDFLS